METLVTEHSTLGPTRDMRIEFVLKPAKHCDCDLIDFRQTYAVANREGEETFWREAEKDRIIKLPGDEITIPADPWSEVGKAIPDPETGEYWIRSGGRGDYVETFYSWMADAPGRMKDKQNIRWFKGAEGNPIERKVRLSFRTCAVCILGPDEGTIYGCVKWKLDYPEVITQESLPSITSEGFCGPDE